MTPSTDASPAILDFFCTFEELFLAFGRISSGYPLPGNVYRDIDPYQHNPANLPDNSWYLVECNGNTDSSFGHWKPKGEDCKLYSNSSFSGWRTTLEFYEGQAPFECKTAWVMDRYWIRQADFCEGSKKKEASSLCKVFIGDEQFSNHEVILKIDASIISNAEHTNPNQLVIEDASNNMENGSTSRSKISEDDKMVELAVAGKQLDNSEHFSEMDDLSNGYYLELRDLDEPASPSSSSDNSSCLTMSSDEYFDSMALLRDIERDINHDRVQRGAPSTLSCSASLRLNQVAVHEGASEFLISSRGNNIQAEERLRIDGALPSSSASSNAGKESDIKHLSQSRNAVDHRFNGPSSSSHTQVVVSNGNETNVDGEKKGLATVGRMKKIKRKYLCFMPF